MKSLIKRWFDGPIFPGDEERTRRARFLNALLVSLMIYILMVIAGNLIGGRTPLSIIVIDILMLMVVLQMKRWLLTGNITLVGVGLVTIGFIFLTFVNINLGTIRNPTAAGYFFLVIMAGALFDLKGILFSTIASSLALLALILAENAGILPLCWLLHSSAWN